MLKAIEWRTVFGTLLIITGPLLGFVYVGLEINASSTGFLITALSVFSVALVFRTSGIPIRATLMFLSLPVGFWISLLFAFNGSEDSQLFQSSIAAAVAGGILFLLGYQKDWQHSSKKVPALSLILCAFIITLGPLLLITFLHSVTRPLLMYFYPPELMMAVAIVAGLVLLQRKAEISLVRYQFATCYGAILSAAIAVIHNIGFYDNYWIQKRVSDDGSNTLYDFVFGQLITLMPLMYAIGFYAVIVLISIAKNKTEDLMLKNWHLSEAYIFLTFMIIAPQSIYETIAGAAG